MAQQERYAQAQAGRKRVGAGRTATSAEPAWVTNTVGLQQSAGNAALARLVCGRSRPLQRVRGRNASIETKEDYNAKLERYNGFNTKGKTYAQNLEKTIAQRASSEDKNLLTAVGHR